MGHDRGARVTHRLCLDYPKRVVKAVLLDNIPTRTLYESVNQAVASVYFYWFFLIQDAPLPESLIGGDPINYLHGGLGARLGGVDALHPDALVAFERNFQDPAVIHATCKDYRAGATIDLEHDKVDSDNRIQCPLLLVWGTLGPMDKLYVILATWQDKALTCRGWDWSVAIIQLRKSLQSCWRHWMSCYKALDGRKGAVGKIVCTISGRGGRERSRAPDPDSQG